MAHYSQIIARGLGLDEVHCKLILQAAPMHDVGKIGIPDHILLKPGR
jgi:HD-GYP domain-containing protein (c-di-GMP phosphodiesterase class II)